MDEPITSTRGDIDALKAETPPLDKCPDSPRSGSVSPDGKCPICLGAFENRSFTDSCFHTFCFTCLQEWSQVKPECPLCKQKFKSIIHNVRSSGDYDKYELVTTENDLGRVDMMNEMLQYGRWPSVNNADFQRSLYTGFRQRTSAESLRNLMNFTRFQLGSFRYRNRRQRTRVNVNTTSIRPNTFYSVREHIYNSRIWVKPVKFGRFRDTSPEFFWSNPASTHRLVQWLGRDLNALQTYHNTNVTFLIELILSLLPLYDIRSHEFYEKIRPFLGEHTNHFIHELYQYARSPHDMSTYDSQADYNPTRDVEVIDLSPENTSTGHRLIKVHAKPDHSTARDVDISPKNSSSTTSKEPWDTPPSSDPLSLQEPGPSGLQKSIKRTANNWDSDSSECLVIDCLKPKKERTPEIITIDSESDNSYSFTESFKHVLKNEDENSKINFQPLLNKIISDDNEPDSADSMSSKQSSPPQSASSDKLKRKFKRKHKSHKGRYKSKKHKKSKL